MPDPAAASSESARASAEEASPGPASGTAAASPSEATRSAPQTFVRRVALVLTGWTLLNVAILTAILADHLPGGYLAGGVVFLVLELAMAVILAGFRDGAYPGAWTRVLVYRPFWYAELALPFLTIAGIVGLVVGFLFGAPLAAARILVGVVGFAIVVLAVAGYVGSRSLRVVVRTFSFPNLPPAFDGLRIVQLTDLHVGPQTSASFLRRVRSAITEAKPDIVAFTGDQVDDFDRDVAEFAKAFGGIEPTIGAFAIAGNHDIYAGWDPVRRGLEAMGIRVLVNDAVPLDRAGARIWIAGTGDPAGEQPFLGGAREAAPDIERTLGKVPRGEFVLALAHNPDLWPPLRDRGVELTLSGHTHHGQLSIPSREWSLASLFLEFPMGTFDNGHSVLYVSPGTNYWGLPLRLGAWPEVTVIVLRRGERSRATAGGARGGWGGGGGEPSSGGRAGPPPPPTAGAAPAPRAEGAVDRAGSVGA
jgi:predicted MPP superfamily phosphohydrolase